MTTFLDVLPLLRAQEISRGICRRLEEESVPLAEAGGRVLARAVLAGEDIPGFSRSVVDGYAVMAPDTTGAAEAIPAMLTCTGEVRMGAAEGRRVEPGRCVYVPTGGILPEGADAVAMIEYCERIKEQVLVRRSVAAGENVTFRGDDFSAGEEVVEAGRRLFTRELGVLAALGLSAVPVVRRPRVGIFSTGDEIVPVDKTPGPAEVRDVNSMLCRGFADERGCLPVAYGIIPDEAEKLQKAIIKGVEECDLVLISGGSSKGERDMCAQILGTLGEVLVHGIALSPGKPAIVAEVKGTPVIGLPGHPASAYIVLLALVDCMIEEMTSAGTEKRRVAAVLAETVPSARGREDYVRVILKEKKAVPLFGKSGLTNTLLRSDGVIVVPAGKEGLEAGEEVEVILW